MHDGHRYDDIINLPHHQSAKHPRMSMKERAAQFSAYDTLAGYYDMIDEEARPTESAAELAEDAASPVDPAASEDTPEAGGQEPEQTDGEAD